MTLDLDAIAKDFAKPVEIPPATWSPPTGPTEPEPFPFDIIHMPRYEIPTEIIAAFSIEQLHKQVTRLRADGRFTLPSGDFTIRVTVEDNGLMQPHNTPEQEAELEEWKRLHGVGEFYDFHIRPLLTEHDFAETITTHC